MKRQKTPGKAESLRSAGSGNKVIMTSMPLASVFVCENISLSSAADQQFVSEFTDEFIDRFHHLCRQWLKYPAAQINPSVVQDLYRTMHGLKGCAGCVGANFLVNLCQESEELLKHIPAETTQRDTWYQLLLWSMQQSSNILQIIKQRSLMQQPPASLDCHTTVMDASYRNFTEMVGSMLVQLANPAPNESAYIPENPVEHHEVASETHNRELDELLRYVMDQLSNADAKESSEKWQRTMSIITSAQTVSVQTFFESIGRVAEELGASLHKTIRLSVQDTMIAVEKNVLNALKIPFIHIIRNAVDHGLETDDERIQLKKNLPAALTVSWELFNGILQIQIQDDGRGLDQHAILRKSAELNLPQHSLQDWRQLIFEPGFSTKAEANTLSGRGIGLDSVKRIVQQLDGSIMVSSKSGRGTCFSIMVPIKSAIINGQKADQMVVRWLDDDDASRSMFSGESGQHINFSSQES